MNFNKIWKFILIFYSLSSTSQGYRPVVLLHGILSDAPSMLPVAEQIILVRKNIFRLIFLLCLVRRITMNST